MVPDMRVAMIEIVELDIVRDTIRESSAGSSIWMFHGSIMLARKALA
jgi:hypothetical protein